MYLTIMSVAWAVVHKPQITEVDPVEQAVPRVKVLIRDTEDSPFVFGVICTPEDPHVQRPALDLSSFRCHTGILQREGGKLKVKIISSDGQPYYIYLRDDYGRIWYSVNRASRINNVHYWTLPYNYALLRSN